MRVWVSNYVQTCLWFVGSHSYPSIRCGLAKLRLNLGRYVDLVRYPCPKPNTGALNIFYISLAFNSSPPKTMATISQTIFADAFSLIKVLYFD